MRDVSARMLGAMAFAAGALAKNNGPLLLPTPSKMLHSFLLRPLLPMIAAMFFAISAAPSASLAAAAEAPAKEEHEAVPLKAAEIFHFGKFVLTNSMLVTWIVAAGMIVFAQTATRNIKPVPTGAQNFWEWLVESLYNFLENVIGRDLVKKTFWFFATIFIFILFVNWFGLVPGVGTIGWGHYDSAHGSFRVEQPLLRGGNADLNMTTAMAAIFFVLWIVWAIQANGVGGFLFHIFGPKGETSGLLKFVMVVIFFMVGWLEVISILFRPISLSFRLFGNVYAGESILEAMSNMVPMLSWLIPIPFYFMEVLVGLVQALVFMLLTAVFTLLIAQHQPGHEPQH